MASLQAALKNSGTKPTVSPAQNQWQQRNASVPFTVKAPGGALLPTNGESDLAAAYVAPTDYNTGSGTNAAVRPNGQALTQATGYRHVAGHLVNNHLGGSGQLMANIATFSHQDNMDHKTTEAPAKGLVAGGTDIVYWTVIKERADYTVNGYTVRGAASKMMAGWFNEATGVKGNVNTYNIGPDGDTHNWSAAPMVSKRYATGARGPDEGAGPSLLGKALRVGGALLMGGAAMAMAHKPTRDWLMGEPSGAE